MKATNPQQEQNLMDSGVKKVETRVEEPDWTDLSRSSKPGDWLGCHKIVDTWVTQQLVTSWKANRVAGHMT